MLPHTVFNSNTVAELDDWLRRTVNTGFESNSQDLLLSKKTVLRARCKHSCTQTSVRHCNLCKGTMTVFMCALAFLCKT